MTTLEIIKILCVRKGITIKKLEKELGFSNGSISKPSEKGMSSERLLAVSKYFNVSMEYLMGEYEEIEDVEGLINELEHQDIIKYDRLCDIKTAQLMRDMPESYQMRIYKYALMLAEGLKNET